MLSSSVRVRLLDRLSYLGFCYHTDVPRVAHNLFVYTRESTTRVNRLLDLRAVWGDTVNRAWLDLRATNSKAIS